jgi:hypothetical protein
MLHYVVIICLSGLLVTTGCTTPAPLNDTVAKAGWDSCGAGRLGGYVGREPDTLDPQYLPLTVRIIGPDDPVTEDYSATRLNVDLDRQGLIRRFWCG